MQKWAGIVVKTGKRSGAVRKDYHRIKGTAAKFHKSSIKVEIKTFRCRK